MTTSTPVAINRMQQHGYWEEGRLVVHISGSDAGNLRLDLDVPEFHTAEDAVEHVKLVIPGEASPLNATGAVGANGRFVLSFFSSDIANAGHLPAEAVACWDVNGSGNRMRSVHVVSAMKAELEQGEEAANLPVLTRKTIYPTTVGLLAVGGVAIVLVVIVAVLMQVR